MTTNIAKSGDTIYQKFNEEDEIQIINSEKYLTSGQWLYEVQGQYSISYDGIRAFAAWLARLECSIKSIIHTVQKQDHSINITQINNAIGILQSEKIIQVNNNIASLTPTEKQFITLEIQS